MELGGLREKIHFSWDHHETSFAALVSFPLKRLAVLICEIVTERALLIIIIFFFTQICFFETLFDEGDFLD